MKLIRAKETGPPVETIADRVTYLLKRTNGTMPIGMAVRTEEEAVEARRQLAVLERNAATD